MTHHSETDVVEPESRSPTPDSEARASELGRLFQRLTGETSVTEAQETDGHASHVTADGLEEYKRRHDEVSRHEALDDALSEPERRQ